MSDREGPSRTPTDRRAHRAWLVGLVEQESSGLPSGRARTVVDVGCGRGEDLALLADRLVDPHTRLVGLDGSAAAITAAAAAIADSRVALRREPLGRDLPFADASLDVVYSHNLLECLPDAAAFAREVARVLRPGGQVVVGHWDWDTQCWDASDRALVRRLVAAYADWQQAWMAHADGWMGRRLHGVFAAGDLRGAFDGTLHARVLTNTAFEAPWFGHENARALGALARRGLAAPDDVARFLDEQAALHAAGRYVYAITGFAFVGRRRA
jgi:SAM-dependent methyltransferase